MGSEAMTFPEMTSFRHIKIPQQKTVNGVPFPVVLSPKSASTANLGEAVRAHKPWLEARLHEAGAVLFRGFDIPTAVEFNDVVEGFGYDEIPFMVGSAPRTHVVGRIYTSNDGPPNMAFPFHNEMSYIEEHPHKVFFYCEIEPCSQGETPIVLGHVIYERMKKKHAEFLQCLENHGVLYYKVLGHDTDTTSAIGRGWKSTFSTDDKVIAEQKAAQTGWKLEWIEDGVGVIMGPIPGIKIDSTGIEERKIWFNHIVTALTSYVDARYKTRKAAALGDGTPIPPEVVDDCNTIVEEECVVFPWKQGDVLMLDNSAVQHSRRSFIPPRRVLSAFTK